MKRGHIYIGESETATQEQIDALTNDLRKHIGKGISEICFCKTEEELIEYLEDNEILCQDCEKEINVDECERFNGLCDSCYRGRTE